MKAKWLGYSVFRKAMTVSGLAIVLILLVSFIAAPLGSKVSDDASAYYVILNDRDYLTDTQWKSARAVTEQLTARQAIPHYGFAGNVPSIFNAGFRYNNICDVNGKLAILLSYNNMNVFIRPLHALEVGNSLAEADILCHILIRPVKYDKGSNSPGHIYAELYDAKTLDYLGSMTDAIVFFGQRDIVSDKVGSLLNSMEQMQALGMFQGGTRLEELERFVAGDSGPLYASEPILSTNQLKENNCVFLTYEPVGLKHRPSASSIHKWKYLWSAHPANPEPSENAYSYIIIQVNEYEYAGDYSGGAPSYHTKCKAFLLDFHTLQVLATHTTTKTRPNAIHVSLDYGAEKEPMSETFAAFSVR